MTSLSTFAPHSTLDADGHDYEIYCLGAIPDLEYLPYSLKMSAENLLRTENSVNITTNHVRALAAWDPTTEPDMKIQFTPARVVMQDFTDVPCIVDLAVTCEAVADPGGDPEVINPLDPAGMVIDHFVQIDSFGLPRSLGRNRGHKCEHNVKHYQFLHWGQGALPDFHVVPPDTGIVHQVNIGYLAHAVFVHEADGITQAHPDTCVGTNSYTTIVNGLGVLDWGVDGTEAETTTLDRPVFMLIPKVVGFKLPGAIPAGAVATDMVLTTTEMLHAHGVMGGFVEFYDEGVTGVSLTNRATIGNMNPEFGPTAAVFLIDGVILDYLHLTG